MSNTKETTQNILQRLTSPWFFTFIPWWVVFNYDFILLVIAGKEKVEEIKKFYGCEGFRYTIFGCADENYWFHYPLVWKFLLPFVFTLISLTLVNRFIRWVENIYESIQQKDLVEKHKQEIKTMQSNHTKQINEAEEKLNEEKEKLNEEKEKREMTAEDQLFNYVFKKIDGMSNIFNKLSYIKFHIYLSYNKEVDTLEQAYTKLDITWNNRDKIHEMLEQDIIKQFDNTPEMYHLLKMIGIEKWDMQLTTLPEKYKKQYTKLLTGLQHWNVESIVDTLIPYKEKIQKK
ncbi:MAG: hypothetical protein ACI9CD_000091 [Candidatus Deianiraeaceae bacterium]|jgi:hypothetical protein